MQPFKDPAVSASTFAPLTLYSSTTFLTPWLSVSGLHRGEGEPVSGLRAGSGTLSWEGEDADELHQHRAALMKGPAAGRPSGYADHWFNWPNEMQRCHSEVGCHRTEMPAGGSERGRKFFFLSFFLRVCCSFLKGKVM